VPQPQPLEAWILRENSSAHETDIYLVKALKPMQPSPIMSPRHQRPSSGLQQLPTDWYHCIHSCSLQTHSPHRSKKSSLMQGCISWKRKAVPDIEDLACTSSLGLTRRPGCSPVDYKQSHRTPTSDEAALW
jgi:hypothetical protein